MRSTVLADSGRFAENSVAVRARTTSRMASGGGDCVDVQGVDYLRIFTSELRRSVAFYARVFGFRVLDATARRDERSVLMATGGLHLTIQERPPNGGPETARTLRRSFVVDDVDRERASMWNLGVVPIRDGTAEAPRDRTGRTGRSFVVRDPGGNEIEVVELASRSRGP
jgi:catechol 2,3-dioxygenase-like lactoylglutathione lyase family enzyme